MSDLSPCPVNDSEYIARFVFDPMHITRKRALKPSFFDYVFDKGCSVQRDSIAPNGEVLRFIAGFVRKNPKAEWLGVVSAKCAELRSIVAPESGHRALCVYDTAEEGNPAHAEMCSTRYIVEEADRLEVSRHLMAAFGDGVIQERASYRRGGIWTVLQTNPRWD
jgi:hypothetical protein